MPELFNVHGFGLPEGFTLPSSCPWVDHVVSGLPHTTNRPIQTRFRSDSVPEALSLAVYGNSPVHYPRGTQSAGACAIGLLQLVSAGFQVLLTPLEGVLFTFQSPYWFTIGRAGVLSLGGWSPHVQSEFHELRPNQSPSLPSGYRTVTFCGRPFQDVRLWSRWLMGWSAFARRY